MGGRIKREHYIWSMCVAKEKVNKVRPDRSADWGLAGGKFPTAESSAPRKRPPSLVAFSVAAASLKYVETRGRTADAVDRARIDIANQDDTAQVVG